MMKNRLILASSSVYRATQMAQAGYTFSSLAADIDETAEAGEIPAHLAERLAASKCREIARENPDAFVVGGDQVGETGGKLLTKPGNFKNNVAQLEYCANTTATFHSAFAVFDPSTGQIHAEVCTTHLEFKALTLDQIETYVELEKPYDCAGGFKIESRGILLFRRVSSDDTSALIGLPMIGLSRVLSELGYGFLS